MTNVLILGNGISRLAHEKEIFSWQGEVWGANAIYREVSKEGRYGQILNRLSGHRNVLEAAREFREEKGYSYELWAGHHGRLMEGAKPFTVEREFLRDTGTSLVAQALHEGHSVTVCGYDLGGPDIHSPGLWSQNKRNWVSRWVDIFRKWGESPVNWIGHDHSEYVLSVLRGKSDSGAYARNYIRRRPHIPGDVYNKIWKDYMGIHDKQKPPPVDDHMVKVIWLRTGHEGRLKKSVAGVYVRRGKVKIVEQESAKKVETVMKTSSSEDTGEQDKKKGRRDKS
jgi:hypothetical protein